MNCEICGSNIYGLPKRIVIEGSRLLVCMRCSSLGEPDLKREETPLRTTTERVGTPRVIKPVASRLPREVEELEVTDDFPRIIKKAREKNKMSQQDLARAIRERLSIVQKIELGKMAPDLRLTHSLEHTLKIKLLLPRKETDVSVEKPEQSEPTLGDVIQYKKK
jgi:putative transcription factor